MTAVAAWGDSFGYTLIAGIMSGLTWVVFFALFIASLSVRGTLRRSRCMTIAGVLMPTTGVWILIQAVVYYAKGEPLPFLIDVALGVWWLHSWWTKYRGDDDNQWKGKGRKLWKTFKTRLQFGGPRTAWAAS